MAPIKGSDQFAVLPIKLPSAPSYPTSATHEIRVRPNLPATPTPDDPRSLFLKNIPADSTGSHFRALFRDLVGAGRFESITFDRSGPAALPLDPAQATRVQGLVRKRKLDDFEEEGPEQSFGTVQLPETWTRRLYPSGSTAIVLLADDKSVSLVMKAIAKLHKTRDYPVWGHGVAETAPSLGSSWVSSHLQLCRADKGTVQTAVHAFFTSYNQKEKDAAEMAKRLRNEPDDDGFVTVVRGGRVAPASRNEAEDAKRKMIERQEKKNSELKDFYRFQLRERRKADQAALARRFTEDAAKVRAMREKRGRFQPET